jgi:hypothetical protein
MKRLFEIVAESADKSKELNKIRKEFKGRETDLINEIAQLDRLIAIAEKELDVVRIQLAESVLYVNGNPYGINDQRETTIAEQAIVDIAQGTPYLRKGYYGNKRYEGYYQGSNHSYGYGPKHGSVVDEVGLRSGAIIRDLTDDEKDACIYYLKNYPSIQAAKTVK